MCYQFRNTGRCSYRNCKFAHISGEEWRDRNSKQRRQESKANRKPNEEQISNSEEEFRTWRTSIPLDLRSVRPLGGRLSYFFQEARRLIEIDANLMQDVIRCLSQEGGLKRIQELIEWGFDNMSTAAKTYAFTYQIIPFFQTISHPDVLGSLVLEQAVGTIYNFLFGIGGRRTILLFTYILDVLTAANKTEEATITHLELSLAVLSHILDINSAAFVQESLGPLAKRFEDISIALHASQGANQLHLARTYLERIQRRLEIGSSLPAAHPATTKPVEQKSVATFVTYREPPGGRHDNDHRDICKINIMPTFEEIMSPRSEYLPVKDPAQWHVAGIDGLLDRNFRLLREDTVGQLRDAIQLELHRLLKLSPPNRKDGRSNQMRTHIYKNARVLSLDFDRLSGFQFEVQFSQIHHIRLMPENKRREWWQTSKRLQADALVCLADSTGYAIFCTVIGHEKVDRKDTDQKKDLSGLWTKEKTASRFLSLVESNDENVQHILNHYHARDGSSTLSLVEFPGVLLPSFQSTLRALQNMKDTGYLPFSEFLAPTDPNMSGPVDVPPPAYALKPGFSFSLRCLTKDEVDLEFRPGKPFDIREFQEHSILDDAQAVALVNTLQRKIGLIQGPPGTGKSFTGVALIKVLLENKTRADIGPVICVCYTNHALDQLLEDLLEKKITSRIIRIGSQSKSEKLEPFNLKVVARDAEKTKMEKYQHRMLGRELDQYERDFHRLILRLRTADSEIHMKNHLQKYYERHYRQLFAVDHEGFQKRSEKPRAIIGEWLRSGVPGNSTPRHLTQLQEADLHELSAQERRLLYQHWLAEIRTNLHDEAKRVLSSYRDTKDRYDNVRSEQDLRCLRKADVIGITTTGLARNLNMLRRVRSKVIICEEAGEVLEAHLLTALLPSIEHAILIGDHLQLRPQIQNYELSRENPRGGEQYSLDVSLFERLVEAESGTGVQVPYSTLETQRRMHPSIAQLLRDTLYPQLKDAPSVFEYPEVSGMRKRLFWLDHRKPEANTSGDDAMATSHWNDYEIDMTTALVNHLIRQGTYESGEIAVLTPYLAQLHKLRHRLGQSFAIVLGERDQDDLDKAGFETDETGTRTTVAKTTLLQTLRVATIDNFQGEEAKVVVISLVRSNEQNRCGFLRTSNRINVLLSRAKHGMYIIGNSATSIHVPMWAQVIDILQKSGNIGTSLELRCPRHPDTPIEVSKPDHFLQFSPEGGCNLRCVNRLPCGHACVQKCHSEILHNAVHCLEPCPRPQKGCNHPCPRRCGDPCPPRCETNVFKEDRSLPCGHLAQNLPCWQTRDLATVRCTTVVKRVVPGCEHEISIHCSINVSDPAYKCTAPCRANLSCGHTCTRKCLECIVRDGTIISRTDHGICKQKCGRKYSTCAHTCQASCHGQEPCPPCKAPCDIRCGHSKCVKKCHEPCTPCAEEKCLSACPHSACSMPCAAPCDHIPCSRRCEKKLACGHQCPSVCGERCPDERFCQTCGSEEVKNHEVDFILGQPYRDINLDENPCIFPQCGHFLTMESMDGQMDIKKYYDVDADEKPVAIASSSEPFSMSDIKTCATCRGSLRDIARYGRLVRRALLDESTKKFIVYLNREYVPLVHDMAEQIRQLKDKDGDAALKRFYNLAAMIQIEGPRDHQIKLMHELLRKHDKSRWSDVMKLRSRIVNYRANVKVDEQPFNRVRDMVDNARRRKGLVAKFDFDENILQTKGVFLATALLLRLDIALLADFLSMMTKVKNVANGITLKLNLKSNKEECLALINKAASSQQIAQQVEGYIFLAQLYALERSYGARTPDKSNECLKEGRTAIEAARQLCTEYPSQTRGLSDEVDAAEKMLNGSTFYTAVTNEERMAVIAAMAREFRGTGHWYYCRNGHPFTIGECGMPMQLATCPECGAPVGGEHHQAVEGVQRATDLEDGLRNMRIG